MGFAEPGNIAVEPMRLRCREMIGQRSRVAQFGIEDDRHGVPFRLRGKFDIDGEIGRFGGAKDIVGQIQPFGMGVGV